MTKHESSGMVPDAAAHVNPLLTNLSTGAAVITRPGYYSDVAMHDYVSDPAPEPSLSTGIVHALFFRTPSHAWQMHPRLGGAADQSSTRGDLGSAIHSLVLGGPRVEYVGEVTLRSGKNKGTRFVPTDWKTADAQEARDQLRATGAIPLLEHQRAAVEAAATNARRLLEQFGAGSAEQTMVWQHPNGVWCRGRADWLTDDGCFDIDLKSCDNADPATWIRQCLVSGGYDIQAALRICGHEALSGRTRDLLFLLVEISPPYAASLVGVGPQMLELARIKIETAASLWRRCLDSGEWPGYSTKIHWADAPAHMELDVQARAMARAS
jgi:PDDEXK-like domain of unknown function (DUF3799)